MKDVNPFGIGEAFGGSGGDAGAFGAHFFNHRGRKGCFTEDTKRLLRFLLLLMRLPFKGHKGRLWRGENNQE
jgi:hypothetical protein